MNAPSAEIKSGGQATIVDLCHYRSRRKYPRIVLNVVPPYTAPLAYSLPLPERRLSAVADSYSGRSSSAHLPVAEVVHSPFGDASLWPSVVWLARDSVAFPGRGGGFHSAETRSLDVQHPFEHWRLRAAAERLCSAAKTSRGD